MTVRTTWVHRTEQLEGCLATCLDESRVALDTEFIRTHTYFARLGVLQLATARHCWLIDPLALPACVQALRELLVSPRVVKVVHAGDEDLEIMAQVLGEPVYPVFDTQLAWALQGRRESIGYANLVADQLGHDLPKEFTRSNWLARPLSEGQLRYAALDVVYLSQMAPAIDSTLTEMGRRAWVMEDMARIARRALERPPEFYYRQLRDGWRLRGNRLWLLQQLAATRERICAEKNQLRKNVVSDADLVAIAERRPGDVSALARKTRMSPGAVRREQHWILSLIKASHTVPASAYPGIIPEPLGKADQTVFRELREAVRAEAARIGIPATLLARKRDLESFVCGLRRSGSVDWPAAWLGWREPILGPLLAPVRRTISISGEAQ